MTALWTPPPDMRGHDRAPDRHVSILFDATLEGGHVHITVRAAERHPSVQVDHSRGLCGKITMRPAEWALLHAALGNAPAPEPLWISYGGGARKVAPAGSQHSLHDGQQFIELKGWPL